MQKYKKVKKISQGAFGTVYQYLNINPSQNISSKVVAIKQLFSSSNNVKRELSILQDLPPHKNIIKIHEIINNKFQIDIVMQLGKYDLNTLIDRISYPLQQIQIKKISYQILNGLKILHAKGYIHRDLKPGNIIIDENGYLKLCDFGSAVKCCANGQEYQLQGFTRWYKAPQMLYGSRNYQFQVDIWSLGCIIMQVATGQPYFDGKSQIQILSMMTKQLGNPNVQNWPSIAKMPDFGKISFKQMPEKTIKQISQQRSISLQLADFIKKMIKYDKRSSVQQLLKDPFLKQISELNQKIVMPCQESQKLSELTKKSYDVLKKMIKQELRQC